MGERLAYLNKKVSEVTEAGVVQVIDPVSLFCDPAIVTIEAHPDDAALGEGIIEELADEGALLTNITLTDGGARTIPGRTKDQVAALRSDESDASLGESGYALTVRAGLPDGDLRFHQQTGLAVVKTVIDVMQPELILVTNMRDEHPDHAEAGRIALSAASGEIPVYMMDTVTMHDSEGRPIETTHAFEISQQALEKRDRAYLAHQSQTHGLQGVDQLNFRAALSLPRRRGGQHGVDQASVLYYATPHLPDRLGQLLPEKLIYRANHVRSTARV